MQRALGLDGEWAEAYAAGACRLLLTLPSSVRAGLRLPALHVEDAASVADFYANKARRVGRG